MDKYFGGYFPHLGVNRKQFLSLGRMLPDDDNEPFKMPVLAIKLSSYLNGVSKLHGQISREVWGSLWPGLPSREVPIISITNGIHLKTWLSDEVSALYERYLGPAWSETVFDKSVWDQVDQIPGRGAVERPPAVQGPVDRLRPQAADGPDAAPRHVPGRAAAGRGGARSRGPDDRFRPAVRHLQTRRPAPAGRRASGPAAQQSRAARPVHLRRQGASRRTTPARRSSATSSTSPRRKRVRRRILFLEDYDIDVARFLVQGVDVWLNNPRRPMEASGTSGMKAAVNGVLNLSTLDGWWCEGLHSRRRLGHRRRRELREPRLPGHGRVPGPLQRAGE